MLSLIEDFPQWVQLSLISLPVLSTIFAAIGLIMNVAQQRRNNALSRASLVAEHLSVFSADEDMQSAFYTIEYSEFRYEADFHGSSIEPKVDRLLRHFSNVAMFWKSGLLSLSDLDPLKYQIVRVAGDPEIQKYIKFVSDFAEQYGKLSHPFSAMSDLYEAVQKEVS